MMNRQQRRNYVKKLNTPQKLEQFAKEYQIRIKQDYDKKYAKDLDNAISIFMLAIKYTLHFNEITHLDNEQLKDFMQDLLVTVDYFRTGEYNPRRV